MKKFISLALSLMMIVCVFVSCGGGSSTPDGDAVKVTMKFVADGKEFYSKDVDVYAAEADADATVLDAVECFMDANDDIEIFLDNDDDPKTIQGVNDYVPTDDDERYWDFKIGDDNYGAGKSAKNTEIKNGDVITWGYMTLDEFKALDNVAEDAE